MTAVCLIDTFSAHPPRESDPPLALFIIGVDHFRNLNDRRPWNKGKFIGPKPPLQPRHVWAIRTRLQLDGRIRDLVLFNLAIDSKLRVAMS